MNTWTTKRVTVEEIRFNGDLHQFIVSDLNGKKLGLLIPVDIDNMQDIIDQLDTGRCPIGDTWVDGLGNTCLMKGWGAYLRYEKVLAKAWQLDPAHASLAEVCKVNDGAYPYAVLLKVNGIDVHNGTTLVQGMDLETADEVCFLWNAEVPAVKEFN